jgi:hypothetical protein
MTPKSRTNNPTKRHKTPVAKNIQAAEAGRINKKKSAVSNVSRRGPNVIRNPNNENVDSTGPPKLPNRRSSRLNDAKAAALAPVSNANVDLTQSRIEVVPSQKRAYVASGVTNGNRHVFQSMNGDDETQSNSSSAQDEIEELRRQLQQERGKLLSPSLTAIPLPTVTQKKTDYCTVQPRSKPHRLRRWSQSQRDPLARQGSVSLLR